jgi:cytochrome c-type biogenesis protein
MMNSVTFPVAFLAGLLSFFSPCVLPLIPSYLSYITGLTLKHLTDNKSETRRLTVVNSLVFILGFSLVFIALGAAASFAGQWLFRYRDLIRVIGGWLIIFLGVSFLGVFKLKFLEVEKRLNIKVTSKGYRRSFLVGIIFAAAWTPCVGPILGSILALAGSTGTAGQGALLLAFYSLGFGLPFFLASLAVDSLLVYLKKLGKYMWVINLASGLFLILIGLLLLTGNFNLLLYN